MMVGRCISYWNSPLLGDVLVFRGVCQQGIDSDDFHYLTPEILIYSSMMRSDPSHSVDDWGDNERGVSFTFGNKLR